jgi:hypothetical protein
MIVACSTDVNGRPRPGWSLSSEGKPMFPAWAEWIVDRLDHSITIRNILVGSVPVIGRCYWYRFSRQIDAQHEHFREIWAKMFPDSPPGDFDARNPKPHWWVKP